MNETKSFEQNKIILAGVVSKMSKTPKTTKIQISTSPSRSKKYRSNPEIVFFEGLLEQTQNINPQDHIEIECALLTIPYSKRRTAALSSYLVASKVKKSESKLSKQLGVKNLGGAYDDKNEGVIAGEVVNVHIMPNNNGIVLSVRARANGRVSLPTVVCFGDIANEIKRELVKKGDIVALSCFVNTGKDNNDVYHESLVAREFSLLERQ